jgi:hypothetical protein
MAFLSRWADHPLLRALVIRVDYVDLEDWLDRAQRFFAPLKGKIVGNPAEVRFPAGSVIRTGHLHDKDAYMKYQGHEYQKMLVEELTHIPSEELYEKLRASNRSTVDELRPQLFSTANPGEIGHLWVKARFVDVARPGEPFYMKDAETGLITSRIFIPAKVEDNPVLMAKDPSYVARLNALPEDLRKAWREGSWDVYEVKGAYYANDLQKARNEHRICRMPYEHSIPVRTAWDIGVDDFMAIWFVQCIGKEIRLIDYEEYQDKGLDYGVDLLKSKGYQYGTHYFPHDMAIREASTAKSRKEFFDTRYKDIFGKEADSMVVSRHEPADGIQQVRLLFSRFLIDNEKCLTGISRLMQYRKDYDELKQTPRNMPYHDLNSHGADAIRTFAMGFDDALALARVHVPRNPMFDPFEI